MTELGHVAYTSPGCPPLLLVQDSAASTKWAPNCLCGAEIPHNPGCEQEVNMLLSHCSFGCFYCSIKIPWRGKWWPTPLFLPGKSQGQRSLVGYGPRGRKESDTTEHLYRESTSCCSVSQSRSWSWVVLWRSARPSGTHTKNKHALFITGDWNAKVGRQEIHGVTDKFSLEYQMKQGKGW